MSLIITESFPHNLRFLLLRKLNENRMRYVVNIIKMKEVLDAILFFRKKKKIKFREDELSGANLMRNFNFFIDFS